MADFGLKSSVPGISVLTAKPFELVISSRFNQHKILKQGQISSGAGATAQVDHALGYRPFFLDYDGATLKQITTRMGVNSQSLTSGLYTNINNNCYYIFYAPSI